MTTVRYALRQGRRRPLGVVAFAVILVLAWLCLAAPSLTPLDPIAQDFSVRLLPPSSAQLFGTDGFGRDVFSRWLFGIRLSLGMSLAAVFAATALGTSLGLASGYLAGRLDLLLQRVMDTLMGFPFLVLGVVLVAARGASAQNVAYALALGFFPLIARISRSQAVSLREEPWVLAAQACGATHGRVLLRHILPNALPAVLVFAAGLVGTGIVAEATLSFLGLGVPPPYPSVGNILSDGARRYLEVAPWIVLCPTAGLLVVSASFNLAGDMLRDILDPRMR